MTEAKLGIVTALAATLQTLVSELALEKQLEVGTARALELTTRVRLCDRRWPGVNNGSGSRSKSRIAKA